MQITWTKHAQERQQQWYEKLGISSSEIEDAVKHPDQVVPGDRNVLVAQVKRGNGILRVPFIETGSVRKILTVYWTSRVDKYWS